MQVIRNLLTCHACSQSPQVKEAEIVHKINALIGQVDAIEKNHKEAEIAPIPADQEQAQAIKIRNLRFESKHALTIAFAEAMNEIVKAKIDPTKMPKEMALQLAEIIGRYGLKCYADNDLPHPFQSSLYVLQTALVMEQYALGIVDRCPDLSHHYGIEDLYKLEHLQKSLTDHAEFVMDTMRWGVWSGHAVSLSPHRLVILSKILRYTNGCLRNVKPHAKRQETLIETAVASLKAGATIHPLDQAEINNELAEVIYNDWVGILKTRADQYQQQGLQDFANETLEKLSQEWEECVRLSEDPEMMRIRCMNKRLFVEKKPPEEELVQRKQALEMHLAIPKERQRPILIALAWHNLSMFYQRIGDVPEAVKCVNEALKVTSQCLARGENNSDLAKVRANAEQLAEKLKK